MYYLRSVVSDVKLRYRASRVVYDCITKREQAEFPQYLTECVGIADGHPDLILTTLHEHLTFRLPEVAYGALLLLEQLVSLCNYGFHLALAKDYETQDRIIQLAVKRGEGEAHRKAQRLARLTLLEYSRVFVDDRELLRLSSLASSFEHRTRKNLMRCLNVQNRRVRFRDVDKSDIIPISPKESLGSTYSSAPREVTPLRLSAAPEVWPCHVCTYLNAPSATRCAACETLRSVDSVSHRANASRETPKTTPKTTPTIAPRHSPPPPPKLQEALENYEEDDDEEEEEDEETGVPPPSLNGTVTSMATGGGPLSSHWHNDTDQLLPPPATAHSGSPLAGLGDAGEHAKQEEEKGHEAPWRQQSGVQLQPSTAVDVDHLFKEAQGTRGDDAGGVAHVSAMHAGEMSEQRGGVVKTDEEQRDGVADSNGEVAPWDAMLSPPANRVTYAPSETLA